MNPLLLDIPDTLETERLWIRAPRPGDGAALHEAVRASLIELRAWPASLPWAVFEPTLESSEVFCRQGQADFLARRNFPMLLFLKSNSLCIGSSGLHAVDWVVPKCEIGYWCRTGHTGQGLVSEAVKELSDFAQRHLGARRIVSLTDEDNRASRRVAERAGYRLEGLLRHERRAPDGQLRNTCIYALTP
jgi:RimJ/RimL family protein N-acetyltransferase